MALLSKEQFSIHLRHQVAHLLVDQSNAPASDFAIYTLSDPRDVLEIRYVGQTRSPRRRYGQHVNKARLWIPDELPWWIRRPKERPLYAWIRELHRDGQRLPFMSVVAWHDDVLATRAAERALIFACLERQLKLLNAEAELKGGIDPWP